MLLSACERLQSIGCSCPRGPESKEQLLVHASVTRVPLSGASRAIALPERKPAVGAVPCECFATYVRSISSGPAVLGVRRGGHVIDVEAADRLIARPLHTTKRLKLGPAGGNVNGATGGVLLLLCRRGRAYAQSILRRADD